MWEDCVSAIPPRCALAVDGVAAVGMEDLAGTVRTLAEQLGQKEIARILQQTLDEEGACDRTLTEIAESRVNAETAST